MWWREMEIHVSLTRCLDFIFSGVCWSVAYIPKAFWRELYITILKSSVLLILLLMTNVARPASGSYDTVDYRYDFMSFNLKKGSLYEETVTGVVKTILRTMHTLRWTTESPSPPLNKPKGLRSNSGRRCERLTEKISSVNICGTTIMVSQC
jgi:hypothetical protein